MQKRNTDNFFINNQAVMNKFLSLVNPFTFQRTFLFYFNVTNIIPLLKVKKESLTFLNKKKLSLLSMSVFFLYVQAFVKNIKQNGYKFESKKFANFFLQIESKFYVKKVAITTVPKIKFFDLLFKQKALFEVTFWFQIIKHFLFNKNINVMLSVLDTSNVFETKCSNKNVGSFSKKPNYAGRSFKNLPILVKDRLYDFLRRHKAKKRSIILSNLFNVNFDFFKVKDARLPENLRGVIPYKYRIQKKPSNYIFWHIENFYSEFLNLIRKQLPNFNKKASLQSKKFDMLRKIRFFKVKRSFKFKKEEERHFLINPNIFFTNQFSVLDKYRRSVKLFYFRKYFKKFSKRKLGLKTKKIKLLQKRKFILKENIKKEQSLLKFLIKNLKIQMLQNLKKKLVDCNKITPKKLKTFFSRIVRNLLFKIKKSKEKSYEKFFYRELFNYKKTLFKLFTLHVQCKLNKIETKKKQKKKKKIRELNKINKKIFKFKKASKKILFYFMNPKFDYYYNNQLIYKKFKKNLYIYRSFVTSNIHHYIDFIHTTIKPKNFVVFLDMIKSFSKNDKHLNFVINYCQQYWYLLLKSLFFLKKIPFKNTNDSIFILNQINFLVNFKKFTRSLYLLVDFFIKEKTTLLKRFDNIRKFILYTELLYSVFQLFFSFFPSFFLFCKYSQNYDSIIKNVGFLRLINVVTNFMFKIKAIRFYVRKIKKEKKKREKVFLNLNLLNKKFDKLKQNFLEKITKKKNEKLFLKKKILFYQKRQKLKSFIIKKNVLSLKKNKNFNVKLNQQLGIGKTFFVSCSFRPYNLRILSKIGNRFFSFTLKLKTKCKKKKQPSFFRSKTKDKNFLDFFCKLNKRPKRSKRPNIYKLPKQKKVQVEALKRYCISLQNYHKFLNRYRTSLQNYQNSLKRYQTSLQKFYNYLNRNRNFVIRSKLLNLLKNRFQLVFSEKKALRNRKNFSQFIDFFNKKVGVGQNIKNKSSLFYYSIANQKCFNLKKDQKSLFKLNKNLNKNFEKNINILKLKNIRIFDRFFFDMFSNLNSVVFGFYFDDFDQKPSTYISKVYYPKCGLYPELFYKTIDLKRNTKSNIINVHSSTNFLKRDLLKSFSCFKSKQILRNISVLFSHSKFSFFNLKFFDFVDLGFLSLISLKQNTEKFNLNFFFLYLQNLIFFKQVLKFEKQKLYWYKDIWEFVTDPEARLFNLSKKPTYVSPGMIIFTTNSHTVFLTVVSNTGLTLFQTSTGAVNKRKTKRTKEKKRNVILRGYKARRDVYKRWLQKCFKHIAEIRSKPVRKRKRKAFVGLLKKKNKKIKSKKYKGSKLKQNPKGRAVYITFKHVRQLLAILTPIINYIQVSPQSDILYLKDTLEKKKLQKKLDKLKASKKFNRKAFYLLVKRIKALNAKNYIYPPRIKKKKPYYFLGEYKQHQYFQRRITSFLSFPFTKFLFNKNLNLAANSKSYLEKKSKNFKVTYKKFKNFTESKKIRKNLFGLTLKQKFVNFWLSQKKRKKNKIHFFLKDLCFFPFITSFIKNKQIIPPKIYAKTSSSFFNRRQFFQKHRIRLPRKRYQQQNRLDFYSKYYKKYKKKSIRKYPFFKKTYRTSYQKYTRKNNKRLLFLREYKKRLFKFFISKLYKKCRLKKNKILLGRFNTRLRFRKTKQNLFKTKYQVKKPGFICSFLVRKYQNDLSYLLSKSLLYYSTFTNDFFTNKTKKQKYINYLTNLNFKQNLNLNYKKLLILNNFVLKKFVRYLVLFKNFEGSVINRAFKYMFIKFYNNVTCNSLVFDLKMNKSFIRSFFYNIVKNTTINNVKKLSTWFTFSDNNIK